MAAAVHNSRSEEACLYMLESMLNGEGFFRSYINANPKKR